jgi:hypothetical protein
MLFGSLGDRVAEGRERARLAPPYFRMGENAAAEEASRAAIALLESLPPGRELASAYATRAYLRMLSRDNAEGVQWGRHAAELAERLGDQDTVSFGLGMVGTSYVMAGEIDRGVDHLLRSLEVARAAGIELRISSGDAWQRPRVRCTSSTWRSAISASRSRSPRSAISPRCTRSPGPRWSTCTGAGGTTARHGRRPCWRKPRTRPAGSAL